MPPGTPPSLISVVAPVFNEAASLSELVRRIAETARILEDRYAFEILLVDDGSTDGSLEVAKGLVRGESRLRVIELRRNFGQTAALQAGLDAAHGDILISMDSDLQHFPEDIPLLVAKIEEGFDLVCGWRHERREGIVRRWPSWAANLIIRRISRLSLKDFGTTFRAYRGDLIRHMRLLGEQHRFVPALAEMVGARIAEVKIRNIERPFGQSSYGLGRAIGVLLDITFLFFSVRYLNRPLRAFGKIAMLLSLVGIAIAVWLLGYSLLTGVATVREHSGWFMLAAILLLSSLQIMLVGILAEVLVRIYYRLGGSEAYVIRKEWRATETERVR